MWSIVNTCHIPEHLRGELLMIKRYTKSHFTYYSNLGPAAAYIARWILGSNMQYATESSNNCKLKVFQGSEVTRLRWNGTAYVHVQNYLANLFRQLLWTPKNTCFWDTWCDEFDDLCLQGDQNMFSKVQRNPDHVLHRPLPVCTTSHGYSFRPRVHDRVYCPIVCRT